MSNPEVLERHDGHAVSQYRQRMWIEETSRDLHHGWGLREAVRTLPEEAQVGRLVGIGALTYVLQMAVGVRVNQGAEGKQRRAQWTTTDRVSPFWCGQQLFLDKGCDWGPWLDQQWPHLVSTKAHALPLAVAA